MLTRDANVTLDKRFLRDRIAEAASAIRAVTSPRRWLDKSTT
jgi:hypothetical protein